MVTIPLFRVCGLGDFSVRSGLLNSGNHSKSMDLFRLIKEGIRQS